jgi:hypothetical protein
MRPPKSSPKQRTAPRPNTNDERSRDAFVDLVRTQLVALGDYGHLRVRRDGQHLVVEQPGPPDDPEDRWPVFRLTPLGGGLPPCFGLSFATQEGRWEKLPVTGLLADVLSSAVEMLAPYLEPDTLPSDTSGTDN